MLRDLLKKGDFMVKLDLKDAYFTVPVWIGHQKYLRFLWKETLWEFACLPFGLASAPRTFTKIMKPVVATLRNLGIRVIIYLDDLLILADSEQTARLHLATAQNLLENLGFVINLKKSVLSPVQKIEFLGMTVDSLTLCLALPRDKIRGIRRECESLIANPMTTVRQLAHLIGRLSSSIQAVFPAPLYYRYLQQTKIQALRSGGHYESQVVLNQEAIKELQWRAENLMAWNGRALAQPDPSIVIESDASKEGWGAHCNGLSTGGLWSQSEQFLHINCLELLAGSFAIKCFAKDKTNIHIQLFMDNVTALTFINKMGGTKSRVLASLSRDLWQWCLQRQITVSAAHIPGILNVNADRESRSHLDSSDWKLCPAVFQALQNRWGPLDIDLFASRLTNQLPRFVSWRPDPLSEAVDAFSLQWNKVKGYAFSPILPFRQVPQSGSETAGTTASPCSTSVENPTLVSSFIGPSYRPSSPSSPNPQSVNAGRNDSPTNPPPAGRMAYLRQQYEEGGFSVQARDLLSAAWRRNTSDQYASAWRKWTSWCAERKVNPISASLSDIINFLAGEYQQGKQYRTLNVYRSAISMTHPVMDSHRVGEHPMICQLLKGIFNSRPPQPRNSFTWDVSVVVGYIKSLGANSTLSLKVLSQKLAMLLALTSAERSSELAAHDLRFRSFYPEGVVFNLPCLTKSFRSGKNLKQSFHASFPEDKNLCVVECLREYEAPTKDMRPVIAGQENKLFLSIVQPHKPVSSGTVARWVRSLLQAAGIDTSQFKHHSVRVASPSAAARGGIALPDILALACWSSESTLRRFYYKPVLHPEASRAVLSIPKP